MARTYPALEIQRPTLIDEDYLEQILAALDDAHPTAIEERDGGQVRVFFATPADRASGRALIGQFDAALQSTAIDVSDEDWAVRSQIGLGPIRVGTIVVLPHDASDRYLSDLKEAIPGVVSVFIPPSMGFGTGHHASTRRCLELLQRTSVDGARVLDAGTGSGVLAIAAWRLGAREVVAADYDADALTAARENVERNGATRAVQIALLDLAAVPATGLPGGRFDLILANLTGATLIRFAEPLTAQLGAAGRIIASGFQTHEVDDVTAAFARCGLTLADRSDEDSWVGALFTIPTASRAS